MKIAQAFNPSLIAQIKALIELKAVELKRAALKQRKNKRKSTPIALRSIHENATTNGKINSGQCDSNDNVTSPSQLVTVEKRADGICIIRFNRPASRNALCDEMTTQLSQCLKSLRRDKSLKVLILSSAVPGIFCAGADLNERIALPENRVARAVDKLRRISEEIYNFPTPTIAAIDGAALGGGLEFALACDFRIGSSNSKLGLVETKLAIIPGAGGTQRLSRLIGLAAAKELIFTGRILNGDEAQKLGLLSYVVPQNESKTAAFDRSMEFAGEMVTQTSLVLRTAKQALNKGFDVALKAGLEVEKESYDSLIPTHDRIEALTAFKEKRKPQFQGR